MVLTQPTKVAGTLRRAVRSSAFTAILGGRHMGCAYYFDFCRLCRYWLSGNFDFCFRVDLEGLFELESGMVLAFH